jgi:hypothetical protein
MGIELTRRIRFIISIAEGQDYNRLQSIISGIERDMVIFGGMLVS